MAIYLACYLVSTEKARTVEGTQEVGKVGVVGNRFHVQQHFDPHKGLFPAFLYKFQTLVTNFANGAERDL